MPLFRLLPPAVLLLLLAATPSGALESASRDLALAVADAGFEAPVGVYIDGSPAPASRAVGSLVMAQLSSLRLAPVPVEASDPDAAEREARSRRLHALLRLTVAVEAGQLVLRGDALSTRVNFWSGPLETRAGPALALLATAPLDARALAMTSAQTAPVPLTLTLQPLAKLPGRPGAVALDGALAFALVDEALQSWNLLTGRPQPRLEVSGPASTRPVRDPFGAISVTAGRATVWSGRRAPTPIHQGPVTLTPRPGFASFEETLSWNDKPLRWRGPLAQVSTFDQLLLAVTPTGAAGLSRGAAPTTFATGVGSGSALCDLDGDGEVEVVLSNGRSTGDGDDIRVLRLSEFEKVQARGGQASEAPVIWQQHIEGRAVVAAASRSEVLLGVWRDDGTGELLVLRRAP